MDKVRRKVTYKLYPTPAQAAALEKSLRLHQRLYNALLEQRIAVYRSHKVSLGYARQCKELTRLRAECPEYEAVNAQSLQVTAKRLDRAYENFFARVKAGEKAGFPRFKSYNRFSGFGFKTYGDGWKLDFSNTAKVTRTRKTRGGRIRITGMGWIRMRGMSRNGGEPKTVEICRKGNLWFASVTYVCSPQRQPGNLTQAFDWGVETFLTIANEKRILPVRNPRHLGRSLDTLAELQRALARKKKGSVSRSKCKQAVTRLHRKIANRRLDFLHKTASRLVGHSERLVTEKLNVRAMTLSPKAKVDEQTGSFLPNGAARKAGLNRSILDTSPSLFLQLVRCKAEEARVAYEELETRSLKPSQRCAMCSTVVKKALSERWHSCACGFQAGRDANSALVMLRFALGLLRVDPLSKGLARNVKPPKGVQTFETPPVPAMPCQVG